jgi:HK97 family phage prohead protease
MAGTYDPSKYDPAERHRRYEESKKNKGRRKGAGTSEGGYWPTGRPPDSTTSGPKPSNPSPNTTKDTPQQAQARVTRLEGKIKTLEGSLTAAMTALADKRRTAAETEKKNSDGKTTAKEKQQDKEYRDKNKAKIAEKQRKERESSSSSGGSSTSSSTSVADMSVDQLESRVSSIRSALSKAKKLLSDAKRAAGTAAHSDDSPGVKFVIDLDEFRNRMQLAHSQNRKESVRMTDADFGGYATRHDVECADGRVILPGAFEQQNGTIVPLVYSHEHRNPGNVLGHCKLEYRPEGVYAHAYFNDTPNGQIVKTQVKHGDLKFLSIFANGLTEKARGGIAHAKSVMKGSIKEVSVVIAGANPGALIDYVNLAHSDGVWDDDIVEGEAIITTGVEIDVDLDENLAHADTATEDKADEATDDGNELQQILDTLNEEQATAVNYLLSQVATGATDSVEHSDTDSVDEPVVEATTEAAAEVDAPAEAVADGTDNTDAEADADAAGADNAEATAEATDTETTDAEAPADADNTEAGDNVQHADSQEDNSMTHNLFDAAGQTAGARPTAQLTHDGLESIVKRAKKIGSLKEAVEEYVIEHGVTVNGALQHGIENIEYLFPDAQTLESSPAFISRRMEWVDKVLSGVRKSPFSRIRTITADITPDEARARGYIKGNMKNEEFFALSKRETTPQTIYKKQKLDRDDVIDITTIDVVAWLKAEMKVMLDEEIAGAILVGDGRSIGDDDKIKETNIRPIATDAELYVTTVNVNIDDASSSVEELVDAAISHRRYYKGSGQPTFYTTEAMISAFLTVKDNFGRRIYGNLQEVAAVLRVTEVVPVEVMERDATLVGIMVNLSDYTLGADRGGQATMFDDFDIDYNKLRYLIETRLSGALTQPKAALVFRKVAGTAVLKVPTEPTFDGSVVTVPTITGVVYKNGAGTTLTTGSPVTLTTGQELHVAATPASGYYFANNAEDEWDFTGE